MKMYSSIILGAVLTVTVKRGADIGKLNSYLVGSARYKLDFDKRKLFIVKGHCIYCFVKQLRPLCTLALGLDHKGFVFYPIVIQKVNKLTLWL